MDIKGEVLYEDVNSKMEAPHPRETRAGSYGGPSISIPIGVNILSAASANGVTAVAFDSKVEGIQEERELLARQLTSTSLCPAKEGV
ncbi:MAG: hypothetical protein ACXVRU_07245, partial [Gaiellaceae bacterium]